MLNGLSVLGAWGRGKLTATAGTAIVAMTQATDFAYTFLTLIRYTAAATAHTLTVMVGKSRSNTRLAADAAATTIYVNDALTDGAGNALAAGDYVALEIVDSRGKKKWHMGIVDTSGWDATAKSILLTSGTAIPTGFTVKQGAKVVSFGVVGDSGHADMTFTAGAAATTNYPAVANDAPLVVSEYPNEPIIVHSNNATNAGTLETLSAIFVGTPHPISVKS